MGQVPFLPFFPCYLKSRLIFLLEHCEPVLCKLSFLSFIKPDSPWALKPASLTARCRLPQAVLKKNKKFDLIKRIFVSDLTEGLENPSAVFRLNQSFPGAVRLP
jgi:hypothetical protein